MPGGPLPAQQFTGQERDPEASQDYFGARFYQPRHGRFSEGDPAWNLFDPQQLNRYAYARNSPLVFTDPDGRMAASTLPCSTTWNSAEELWRISCPNDNPGSSGSGGGAGMSSTLYWFLRTGAGSLFGSDLGVGYDPTGEPPTGTTGVSSGPTNQSGTSGSGPSTTTNQTTGNQTTTIVPVVVATTPPNVPILYDVGARTPVKGLPGWTVYHTGKGETIMRYRLPNGMPRFDVNVHADHGAGEVHVHKWVDGVRQGGKVFVEWVQEVVSGRYVPSPVFIVNPCLLSPSLCLHFGGVTGS